MDYFSTTKEKFIALFSKFVIHLVNYYLISGSHQALWATVEILVNAFFRLSNNHFFFYLITR